VAGGPAAAGRQPGAFDQALTPFLGLVPAHGTRRVVILAAEPTLSCSDLIASTFGGDRVLLLASQPGDPPSGFEDARLVSVATVEEVEQQMLRFGAVDVVLQLAPGPVDDGAALVERLFFHLRRGGAYVLDRRSVAGSQAWPQLSAALGRALAGASAPEVASLDPAEHELVRSIGRIVSDPQLLIITKTRTHHAKLRDLGAEDVLRTRQDRVRVKVLARREGACFTSRAVVRHHGTVAGPWGFPATIDYPPLTARRYRGRIAMSSHSLLFSEETLLPESFRYHRARRLTNARLVDVNEHFARIRKKRHPHEVLDGDYFHLDSPVPGHFGHLMTEVISRLWAWDVAKAACPDLRAIYRISGDPDRAKVDREVFRAFGIADDDIVGVDRPVQLRSVYSGTPMWHNSSPHSVHPGITEVWQRMRQNLVRDLAPTGGRIFVSRAPDIKNRPCTNTAEVEEYFAERSFAIVRPEHHPLSEQARLFSGAEVVAGFGGSGLFNVLFSTNPSKLIVLSHQGYTARNEYLFASLLGCELIYLWSTPEILHPRGDWTLEAFHSPWAFDFDLHHETLRQILEEGTGAAPDARET
jgi:capsular polysaccharide biosynthesis protein